MLPKYFYSLRCRRVQPHGMSRWKSIVKSGGDVGGGGGGDGVGGDCDGVGVVSNPLLANSL